MKTYKVTFIFKETEFEIDAEIERIAEREACLEADFGDVEIDDVIIEKIDEDLEDYNYENNF